jgi:hypothetical protein
MNKIEKFAIKKICKGNASCNKIVTYGISTKGIHGDITNTCTCKRNTL